MAKPHSSWGRRTGEPTSYKSTRSRSGRDLYAETIRCLREKGLAEGRIGVSREYLLPLPLYHELRRDLPGATFVVGDDILEQLRIRKSPAEVAMMRHSSAVAVEMMDALLSAAAPGRTDGDLAAAAFEVGTRYEATPYEFAFSSRPTSDNWYWPRLPAYDTRRHYETGDLLHPDIFGCVDGYSTDFQRSLVIGGPNPGQREALEAVVDLIHHICDYLRPGNRACDAHAAGGDGSRSPAGPRSWREGIRTRVRSLPSAMALGWAGRAVDHRRGRDHFRTRDDSSDRRGDSASRGSTAIIEETVLVTEDDPEIMTRGCNARWWA